MPIVLAIEPDRRQAAHLTAIVGRQAGAELILADTTEDALDAIGDRVPDLVLVPALLSPQDDASLAAALRVIAAAAHVRTLTIPVLASATKRAAPPGILAKWRRSRAASPTPDGCEPAVFGEQISAYLREAAEARRDLEEELVDIAPPAPEPIEPVAPEPIETVVPESIEAVADQIELVAEPIEPAAESIEPAAAPVQPWATGPIEETLIDLSDELAAMSDTEGDEELFDGEPVGIYTISAETDAAEIETFDLLPAIPEPPAIAATTDEVELEVFDLLPAILEPPAIARPASAPMAETTPRERSDERPEPPRADIEPWVPMYLTPGRLWPALEGMPVETPAPRTEQPDWIELVASLRQDLERRRTDPPQARADPIAARPSDGGGADAGRLAKKHKPHAKKLKPIQDEWGFFDPEQCGFSMLLAKLEEITEEEVRS